MDRKGKGKDSITVQELISALQEYYPYAEVLIDTPSNCQYLEIITSVYENNDFNRVILFAHE